MIYSDHLAVISSANGLPITRRRPCGLCIQLFMHAQRHLRASWPFGPGGGALVAGLNWVRSRAKPTKVASQRSRRRVLPLDRPWTLVALCLLAIGLIPGPSDWSASRRLSRLQSPLATASQLGKGARTTHALGVSSYEVCRQLIDLASASVASKLCRSRVVGASEVRER